MNEPLKNVFALLFGLFVAVLLGEVGARFYVFSWDAFSYQKINSFDHLFRSGVIRNANTDGLIFELKPNYRGYFKLTPFETNKYAMRDDPCDKTRDRKKYRIAIIGDSFTMGTGVQHKDLYHTVVENTLNSLTDTLSYELLNFGVAAYNLPEYVAQFKQKAVHFEPNEVVIGFCGYNDHLVPTSTTYPDSVQKSAQASGFYASYLKRLIRFSLFEKYHPKEIKYSEEQLRFIENNLAALNEFGKLNGIPVSIIYLCNVHKPTEANQIKEIAKTLGMKFTDTSHRFENTKLSEYSINVLDAHPNRKANLLFSEELFGLLKPNVTEVQNDYSFIPK